MYTKKVKHFQELYPEKDCLSGIIVDNIDHMSVGAPCIAIIEPFNMYKNSPKEPWAGSGNSLGSPDAQEDIVEPVPSNRGYGGYGGAPKLRMKSKTSKSNAKAKKTHASDLAEMSQSEMNKVLRRSVQKMRVLFLFNVRSSGKDFYTKSVSAKSIRFSKKKPLIYDKGHHISLNRLDDVHDDDEIKNLHLIIGDSLKTSRYVNYTFSDIARSNVKYMMEDINKIFNSVKKVYKHNTCFYQYAGEKSRLLTDTASIGFYPLNDVMPIFDNKKSEGFCIDIFLTNSRKSGVDIVHNYSSMTYRFVFSASKENIFTIDGEPIQRPDDSTVSSALSRLGTRIREESPNDTALKQKKASLKKKEG